MAKVAARPSPILRRLEQALTRDLATAGIVVGEFVAEPIRGTKLHRVLILAPAFEHMTASERQDLVWRIAGTALSKDEQLRISSILTLTPAEALGRR